MLEYLHFHRSIMILGSDLALVGGDSLPIRDAAGIERAIPPFRIIVISASFPKVCIQNAETNLRSLPQELSYHYCLHFLLFAQQLIGRRVPESVSLSAPRKNPSCNAKLSPAPARGTLDRIAILPWHWCGRSQSKLEGSSSSGKFLDESRSSISRASPQAGVFQMTLAYDHRRHS